MIVDVVSVWLNQKKKGSQYQNSEKYERAWTWHKTQTNKTKIATQSHKLHIFKLSKATPISKAHLSATFSFQILFGFGKKKIWAFLLCFWILEHGR